MLYLPLLDICSPIRSCVSRDLFGVIMHAKFNKENGWDEKNSFPRIPDQTKTKNKYQLDAYSQTLDG